MKLFRIMGIPACSFIVASAAFFTLYQGVGQTADVRQITPQTLRESPTKGPMPGTPMVKVCPDLKVNLIVMKSASGGVVLNGTVSNIGSADYAMPSEAQYIMNLSYPPKTYAQVGVSEQLCTKEFKDLKKGASFPFSCNYTIPDFEGWGSATAAGNAKRLFTLRAVKKDMSSFAPGEECNPSNNSMGVEVMYQAK